MLINCLCIKVVLIQMIALFLCIRQSKEYQPFYKTNMTQSLHLYISDNLWFLQNDYFFLFTENNTLDKFDYLTGQLQSSQKINNILDDSSFLYYKLGNYYVETRYYNITKNRYFTILTQNKLNGLEQKHVYIHPNKIFKSFCQSINMVLHIRFDGKLYYVNPQTNQQETLLSIGIFSFLFIFQVIPIPPYSVGIIFLNNTILHYSWESYGVHKYIQFTNDEIVVGRISRDFNYLFTAEKSVNDANYTYLRKYVIAKEFQLQSEMKVRTELQSIYQIHFIEATSFIFLVQISNGTYRICAMETKQCYNWEGSKLDQSALAQQSSHTLITTIPFNQTIGWINLTHFAIRTSWRLKVFQVNKIKQFLQEHEYQNTQWPRGKADIQQPQVIFVQKLLPPQKVYELPHSDYNKNASKFSRSSKALIDTLSFPNAKTLFKVFNPIFLFVEDYWFYSYHQRNYSKNVQISFDIIREINQAKILPSIFYNLTDYLKSKFSLSRMLAKSNFTDFTPQKFLKNEESDINFIRNTQQILIWNYMYSICGFFILKILYVLCPSNAPLISEYLWQKSRAILLLVTFIQGHIQYYSFMTFSQLTIPSHMDYNDKIKFSIAYSIMFAVIIYSIVGYLLIWSMKIKRVWGLFLQYQEMTGKAFVYMSLNLSIRGIGMGFAHGYFQNYPDIQTIVILILDGCSIGIVIVCWSAGKSKISNCLILLYYGFRFTFDFIVLNELAIKYRAEIFEIILIAAMLINIIILFFWQIFLGFKQILTNISSQSYFKGFSEPDAEKDYQQNAQLPELKLPDQVQCKSFRQAQIQIQSIKKIKESPLTCLFLSQKPYKLDSQKILKTHFKRPFEGENIKGKKELTAKFKENQAKSKKKKKKYINQQ